MASIPVVNGGALPVFAPDILSGYVNTSPANSTYPTTTYPAGPTTTNPVPATNFAGPKYDFYKITLGATPDAGAGGAMYLLLQTLQLYATVGMYSVSGADVSVALYPTGAYNGVGVAPAAGDLDNSAICIEALIQGLGAGPANLPNGGTFDFSTATVLAPGFVLA